LNHCRVRQVKWRWCGPPKADHRRSAAKQQ
jgi:hypothetical protein